MNLSENDTFFLIACLVVLPILLFSYIKTILNKRVHLSRFLGHVNNTIFKRICDSDYFINTSGEHRVITIMFLDIRGFTSISEQLGNRQVVNMLNEYLKEISEIILKHDGLVDKYMGDGVMAFWGAPLYDKNQATKVILAANEISKYFIDKDVGIGIGINTGSAVVGSIGNKEIVSYTAIGDSVNLAARIESLNRQYKTKVLFSESTLKKFTKESHTIKKLFTYREVDRVRVHGRSSATHLYELVSEKNRTPAIVRDGIKDFHLGLMFYRNAKWNEAQELFRKSLHKLGDDFVSEKFIERCKEFSTTPPEGRWDGTISLGK